MIFLPLVAAAIAGLFWRHIGDRGAQLVTCAALLVSMVLAWIVFFDVGLHHGTPRTTEIFTWFLSGGFEAHWAHGVALNTTGVFGPNPRAFGHTGWGGSFAFGRVMSK